MSFLGEPCRSMLVRTFLTAMWSGSPPQFFQRLSKCEGTRTSDFPSISQQKSEEKLMFCRFSNSLLTPSSIMVKIFFNVLFIMGKRPKFSKW